MQTLFDFAASTIVLYFLSCSLTSRAKKLPKYEHTYKKLLYRIAAEKNLILHCDVRTRVQRTISRQKKNFFSLTVRYTITFIFLQLPFSVERTLQSQIRGTYPPLLAVNLEQKRDDDIVVGRLDGLRKSEDSSCFPYFRTHVFSRMNDCQRYLY